MNRFHILIIIAIAIFLLMYAGNSYVNYTYYNKVDVTLDKLNAKLNYEIQNEERKRILER